MPCKKGKHATKAVMAAAKKSDKQDDRARKRDLKKQNRMAKNYECQEEREFKSFLAGISLIIKYMDGDGTPSSSLPSTPSSIVRWSCCWAKPVLPFPPFLRFPNNSFPPPSFHF